MKFNPSLNLTSPLALHDPYCPTPPLHTPIMRSPTVSESAHLAEVIQHPPHQEERVLRVSLSRTDRGHYVVNHVYESSQSGEHLVTESVSSNVT